MGGEAAEKAKAHPCMDRMYSLVSMGFSFFVLKFQFAIGRVVSAPAFVQQDASPMAAWGYVWYALFLSWGNFLGLTALFEAKVGNSTDMLK